MAKYIDKDALVAEIERLISNGETELKESEECKDYESYVACAERIATCIYVLSFLNAIEVKEVDLEKEIDIYYNWLPGRRDDIAIIAKHFFELGMQVSNKTQKGE